MKDNTGFETQHDTLTVKNACSGPMHLITKKGWHNEE